MKLVLDCEATGNINTEFVDEYNFHIHRSVRLIKFDYIMFNENTEIAYSRIVKPSNFAYGKAFKNGRLNDITKEILNTQGVQLEEVLDNLENIIDNITYIISYYARDVTNILLLEMFRLGRGTLLNKLKGKKIICIESTAKKVFPDEYFPNDVFRELGINNMQLSINRKTLNAYHEFKHRKTKLIIYTRMKGMMYLLYEHHKKYS